MNSDFKDLLKILSAHGVEYLIVGGYAVIRYTEPRYTKDLDILVGRSQANAEKTINALKEFGAPLHDLRLEDLLAEGLFYQIGVAPNRIDVITSIPGIDFAKAYSRREEVQIEDLAVPFISQADLIDAKLAAGRPQDLVDAGALAKRFKREG